MSETQLQSADMWSDGLRSFLSFFDGIAYSLLQGMYQLFFNVTTVDLFSNNTITKFYSRVQLIIGVFMLFHLAMTILKGIVNPDTFTDSKSGAGNLITRIALSLVLLTVLVPINIPSPKNEYEKQLNRNGLLFGTLYSLQYRLLSNNTIGRLILGTDDTSSNYTSLDSDDDENIKTASRVFASTVLKGFYRINLLPEDERPKHEEGKDDAIFNDNRVCQDIDDAYLDAYTRLDAEPLDIIGMVKVTCEPDIDNYGPLQKAMSLISPTIAGTSRYAFAYNGFISMIVAFVFALILLSFSVDVAVRAVKLAILRLIAPIPIISYMDPKGSKDGAFNSWVKTLASTYIDLFIRLGTVYFVIYLIQDMIVHGIVIKHGSGILGIVTLIIVWIGLFVFAKQAPKFIKDVLGIKGETGKLFGGFGDLAGAIGLGAGIGSSVLGAIGAGRASARASKMSDETRNALGMTDFFGNPINPSSTGNKAKHLLAGILGGVGGARAGIGAALKAKDHNYKAAMDAIQKRNADAISKGNDGSTILGRFGSGMQQYWTGDGSAAALSRKISTNDSRINALKAVKSRISGEMPKSDWTTGDLGIARDNAGNTIGAVNFKQFEANLAAGRSRGDGKVIFQDASGVSHEISLDDAERQRGFLLKNNEDDYISRHIAGTAPKVDNRLITLVQNAEILGGSATFTRRPGGVVEKGNDVHISNRSSINDAIDGFEDYNNYLKRQNSVNNANDRYSSKK